MKLYSLIYITTNNNLLPRGISILTLIYLLSVKECTKRIFVFVIKCGTFHDNLYFLILSVPFVCKLQNVKKKTLDCKRVYNCLASTVGAGSDRVLPVHNCYWFIVVPK